MSHDQCPTTVSGEKQKPSKRHLAATPRKLQRINGQAAWRSMDELVDAPEFREHLEREFPAAMAELVTREAVDLQAEQASLAEPAKKHDSRREFLKLMGASMALAGVAATVPGCRRPDHKIYTYSKVVPEEIIPGKPLYYVTAMPRWDGGAEGLMVETHEGRPTKIEGNPLHPVNQGKASLWAIASIMSLYDPDRVRDCVFENPARGKTAASFDDFRAWSSDHFKKYENGGEGLAIIAEKSSSPTRAAMRDKLLKKYPKAKWCVYNAAQASGESEGTKLAFGKPMRTMFSMSKANTNVIVSLDRDFTEGESTSLVNARQFASTRMLSKAADTMSRLYVVESSMTNTGGQADHRLRLAPSRVTAFAVLLAQRVMKNLAGADLADVKSAVDALAAGAGNAMGADIDPVFLDECAKDLLDSANRGKSLIMAGPSQPAIVHAIVAVLNAGLDNVGKSVSYVAADDEVVAGGGGQQVSLAELAKLMNEGKISTAVCVNVNPAYDAPGDLKFVEGWKKVGATITLTVGQSETAAASTWAVSGAHYLESWGDVRSVDGTLSPVQPMIAPLYETSMSEIEFLALLAAKDFGAKIDGYEIVRETWKTNASAWLGAGEFETKWRRALHNGVVENTASKLEATKFNGKAVADAIAGVKLAGAPSSSALDVVFTVGNVADGRFANVGWLQELPHAATRVVWDNPVILSPKTAEELGLSPAGFDMPPDGSMDDTNKMNGMYTKPKYPTAKVAELTLGGRTIKCPVWICPGTPDNTAVLMVGYGRTNAGVVGDEVGVNVYPLMSSGGVMSASGLSLKDTGDTHMICSTQNHWTLDGKDSIIRAVDLPAWKKYGDAVQEVVDSFYGTKAKDLNFAERLGELSHVPPNISIYKNPYNKSREDADKSQVEPGDPNGPKYQQNVGPAYASRPQWAMTIDQQTCTGCGACTIACQSENNIPVVGKKETAKGRELAWIRVDRYFTGNDFNNPSAMHQQPVACVHCENAPCEVVCPVSATVHGPEGLNYMTYNRCIGTRYCANNCPYKVRRYNWFDYGVTKFNGGYYFKEVIDPIGDHIPGQEGITGSQKHNSINPNLIPPRLRQKLDEISRMQKNPDVTVRSRGVMEKCSYCIQRINFAKIECKLADIRDSEGKYVVPDGFFQTACQQACPSNAITFGDELDKTSKVHATRHNARSYALLGYLNTRPRTSHMLRVMNPNPEILKKNDPERFAHMDEPFHHGGHEDHGHDDHGHGEEHSFFDTRKHREDSGYAMSLRVLSTDKVGNNVGGVRA